MAHGEYLKAGLALQFHAHRDTWFSAPHQQINWWLPVCPIEAENSMAFHPRYFDAPVRNSSADYDYDEWNRAGRQQAAKIVTKETRRQPRPEEPLDPSSQIRIVTPVGGGLAFSAAQLHATGPNTTTRTRWLRDFLRATDLEPLPDEVVERQTSVQVSVEL